MRHVVQLSVWCSLPVVGAVPGIEMKKDLSQQAVRQAEVEFYLWWRNSHFPYLQVVTDMETGGYAFYMRDNPMRDNPPGEYTTPIVPC